MSRSKKFLSMLLCMVLIAVSVFSNTDFVKAGSDGTGSASCPPSASSGGNGVSVTYSGWGLKFSIVKRRDILKLHSINKTEDGVVGGKAFANCYPNDGSTSGYIAVTYNASGNSIHTPSNLKFFKRSDNKLVADSRFKSVGEAGLKKLTDKYGGEEVFKGLYNSSGHSIKTGDLSYTLDNIYSDQGGAETFLYSQEGRSSFYDDFKSLLGDKAKYLKMSKEDFVKGDGVLMVEPYGVYARGSADHVAITYRMGAWIQKHGTNGTPVGNTWRKAFPGYSNNLLRSNGFHVVLSCGGLLPARGLLGCYLRPKGTEGKYHAPDCPNDKKVTGGYYSDTKQRNGDYRFGFGVFGLLGEPIEEEHAAVNVSVRAQYSGGGKYTITKSQSLISADSEDKSYNVKNSKGESGNTFKELYCNRGSSDSNGNNYGKYQKALNVTKDSWYTGYTTYGYGSYGDYSYKTVTYSNLNDVVQNNIASSMQITGHNVSGSDFNAGKYYAFNLSGNNSATSVSGSSDVKKVVSVLTTGLGTDNGIPEHTYVGATSGKQSDRDEQAKLAYNLLGVSNYKSKVRTVSSDDEDDTITATKIAKKDDATDKKNNNNLGISVQVLKKEKPIISYISFAKLKYDEDLNASLSIGSNSKKKYDTGSKGKFTTNNKRAYIIAVPNCNSNNDCLLKNNTNGSSIWNKVQDKASGSKKVIQLSDVASIITSNTGEQASVQGSANGSRTISVGTDSDDGYSIYVLELDLPKSVPISSVLNLQDYQINYVYPKSLMKESASLGEKVNSNTEVDEITASNEYVSKRSSTWTCGGRINHSSYQDDYEIKLFHGSGTSGHTVSKSLSTNNALLMYNRILGTYNTFLSVHSGWNTTSNNNALRIDYAFNLSRGGLGDKRTISGLSKDSYENEIDYAIDSLDMEYGNKPNTVEAGGTTIRDSWAKYCNRIGDKIKFKSEWVNGGESPVEAYTTSHTYTTGSGTNIKTNTCYYANTRATDSRPIYLRLLSLPLYEVRNNITEKIFKYRTDTIGTGINKWDTDLSDGKKLGGSTLPLDENIKPVSGVNATIPKSDMKENERYRFIVIAKSNKTLSYYPEVGMRAYITSGETLTARGIYAKTILTMGEKIRKTNPSSMYILRVTQPNTGDQVKGSIYSDTTATGSNADDLSKKNGNKPVVYGGSDITLKAEGKFNINMYGYSLDLINKDYDASMKYTTASGDTAYEQYTKVVNNNSDVYSDWGNDSTNSKVELFKQYKDWTESVKNSLTADVTLKVTGDAGYKKLYNDFSTSLGKLKGGTSSEDGVYSIKIRLGKIDTATDQYKGLIKQIAKDYNCDESKAGEIFEKSDIYKTIIRSIEDVNDGFNKAQKVTDTNNRVRTDESDKAWYDEEVKTFVIRRYKTTGVTTPNIVLNDKIDYGMAPDSTKGKDSTYNAQQSEYKSHTGQWYLTLYFRDNHSNKSDTNLYLSEQSLFNPNKSRVSTSENYYKGGNVLINELYIAGADFLIPSSTTSDMVQ